MWTDGITEVYNKVEELTEENDKLKSEIENLKVENQSLRGAADSLKMHYKEAQAEIERLEKIREADKKLITSLNKCYETAKSKAFKEFAEKLKDIFEYAYQFEYGYLLNKDVINAKLEKCLKEMENKNGNC